MAGWATAITYPDIPDATRPCRPLPLEYVAPRKACKNLFSIPRTISPDPSRSLVRKSLTRPERAGEGRVGRFNAPRAS